MKQKLFTKLMSVFLAAVLLFGMFPATSLTASAAPAADIPAKMLDNYVLDSLQYVGYNINYLKESGLIYQTGGHGGAVPTSVLSGIKYSGNLFGVCTVADPSTPTGLAPNVATFKRNGLDCTAFAAYYYFNYLRNVLGKDMDTLWSYFKFDDYGRPAAKSMAIGYGLADHEMVTIMRKA